MNKIHVHKVNWHEFGIHFGHVIHDPRFWGVVALVALFGLMVLMAIFINPTGNADFRTTFPTYPYGVPY